MVRIIHAAPEAQDRPDVAGEGPRVSEVLELHPTPGAERRDGLIVDEIELGGRGRVRPGSATPRRCRRARRRVRTRRRPLGCRTCRPASPWPLAGGAGGRRSRRPTSSGPGGRRRARPSRVIPASYPCSSTSSAIRTSAPGGRWVSASRKTSARPLASRAPRFRALAAPRRVQLTIRKPPAAVCRARASAVPSSLALSTTMISIAPPSRRVLQ